MKTFGTLVMVLFVFFALVCLSPAMAQYNYEIYLRPGGSLNGHSINTSNPVINVSPGENLSGTIKIQHIKVHSGDVVPLIYTPNWGNHSTSYNGVAYTSQGTHNFDVSINNLQAPTTPGTYLIIFASAGRYTYGQVAAMDACNCGNNLLFGDGNDIADLTKSDLPIALSEGVGEVLGRDCNTGNYGYGYAGITYVEINVGAGNIAPTINVTQPSSNISVFPGENVTVAWNGTDPDDPATVSIFYDTDTNLDNGGWDTICLGQSEDGYCTWDTSSAPAGTYYVIGVIDDGNHLGAVDQDVAPGRVTVSDSTTYNYEIYLRPGGSLNGHSINTSNPVINVSPGENISGTIKIQHIKVHSGDVVPLIYTPNWGNHSTSYNGVAYTSQGTHNFDVSINNLQAPTTPGTYLIIFASAGRYTYGQVAAMDACNCGNNPLFGDSNDIADLTKSDLPIALSEGVGEVYSRDCNTGNYGSGGYAGITYVEINVSADNIAPTINVTQPSSNISVFQGENVTVAWNGTDPDDPATVSIFYDTDTNLDNGGWDTICLGQSEDGYCTWDTSSVTAGTYYVIGVIDDGNHGVDVHQDIALGRVTVSFCYPSNPAEPMEGIVYNPNSPLINPYDTSVNVPAGLISIAPQMYVSNCSDVVKPLMYVYLLDYNIGVDLSQSVIEVCSNGIITFDFGEIDLSDYLGLAFDVYYGYLDWSDNIIYNAYEVTVTADECTGDLCLYNGANSLIVSGPCEEDAWAHLEEKIVQKAAGIGVSAILKFGLHANPVVGLFFSLINSIPSIGGASTIITLVKTENGELKKEIDIVPNEQFMLSFCAEPGVDWPWWDGMSVVVEKKTGWFSWTPYTSYQILNRDEAKHIVGCENIIYYKTPISISETGKYRIEGAIVNVVNP